MSPSSPSTVACLRWGGVEVHIGWGACVQGGRKGMGLGLFFVLYSLICALPTHPPAHPPAHPQVISTSGDTHLGGEDFDQRIMEYFIKLIKRK